MRIDENIDERKGSAALRWETHHQISLSNTSTPSAFAYEALINDLVSEQVLNIVFVHGWGMNSAVWQQVIERLMPYCHCHLIDLPGYGLNQTVRASSLDEIVCLLAQSAPEKAIWLGWSLGGVIATEFALRYPDRVSQLIHLASSPFFMEQTSVEPSIIDTAVIDEQGGAQPKTRQAPPQKTHRAQPIWRGVKPQVLAQFSQQLQMDFIGIIERFMLLQAMGSPNAKQEIKQIKQAVFSRVVPSLSALSLGLELLKNTDMRSQLSELAMPYHAWFGRLDALVPVAIADKITQLNPKASVKIFTRSAHAPFLSELEAFCHEVIALILDCRTKAVEPLELCPLADKS